MMNIMHFTAQVKDPKQIIFPAEVRTLLDQQIPNARKVVGEVFKDRFDAGKVAVAEMKQDQSPPKKKRSK